MRCQSLALRLLLQTASPTHPTIRQCLRRLKGNTSTYSPSSGAPVSQNSRRAKHQLFYVYHMSTEGTVASKEGPSPEDATMDVPLPRERRATDAPRILQNLGCAMFCLICGEPNLLETQLNVCPFCHTQDCLIPTSCALSVRCQRSGRDADNRRVYMASTQESQSRR